MADDGGAAALAPLLATYSTLVPAVSPASLVGLFPNAPGPAAPAATFQNPPDLRITKYEGTTSFDDFLQAFSNTSRLITMSAPQLTNLFIQQLGNPLAMEFQRSVNANPALTFWQHVFLLRG
jgi:hypothetical protein